MNCELMLTYDTPALRQTGSRNLTGQKTDASLNIMFYGLINPCIHLIESHQLYTVAKL
jgi:hypothetical protein